MVTINKYNQGQWLAMKALKSGLDYLKTTNDNGTNDNGIDYYKKSLRHFITHEDYRTEAA